MIRDAESLEQVDKIKTIVFDKTGTLTNGKMSVTGVKVQSTKYTVRGILQIAAALEVGSEHPIAEAILAKAKSENITLPKVTNFKAISGEGVTGIINDTKYKFGKSEEGLALTLNGKKIGGITVEDEIKEGATEMINELHKRNISTWMITGDHERTARKISKEIGIENVISGVLPTQKGDAVRNLKSHDQRSRSFSNLKSTIAFIGDGINDAPALAAADIGIAMGTGTDVAIESSGITLLNRDIKTVITTLNLGKSTLRIIRENLFWAFGYNIILIPVAALGLLNPMFAAGAMAASSISVVLNSLRLNSVKI